MHRIYCSFSVCDFGTCYGDSCASFDGIVNKISLFQRLNDQPSVLPEWFFLLVLQHKQISQLFLSVTLTIVFMANTCCQNLSSPQTLKSPWIVARWVYYLIKLSGLCKAPCYSVPRQEAVLWVPCWGVPAACWLPHLLGSRQSVWLEYSGNHNILFLSVTREAFSYDILSQISSLEILIFVVSVKSISNSFISKASNLLRDEHYSPKQYCNRCWCHYSRSLSNLSESLSVK